MNISAEAHSIAGKIKTFVVHTWEEVEPEVKEVATQAFDSFEQKITPEAIQLMFDALEVGEAVIGGDDAQRAAAIEHFVTEAKSDTNSVAVFAKNEANALLELVYITFKAKMTAATTSSTPPTSTATINSPGVSV